MITIRRALVPAAVLAVALAGCAATASPSPATSSPPAPSSASVSPPASSPAEPTPSSGQGGCPVPPTTGALPSNTLTGLTAEAGPTADRLTFTFGDTVELPVQPVGHLAAATPPFTMAGSGDVIDIVGDHFLTVIFTGMSLADEQGNPAFQTQRDARWGLAAVKQTIVFDESEGQVGIVVGYTGDGCVALGGDPAARTVTLDITHPPG
jgi:hypothetical protein